MDDSLVLVDQLDLWGMHLEVVYFLVNLRLKFLSFLFLDLTVLEHFFYVVVLMNQKVILSASVLDGLTDFGEHLFNVREHVLFSALDLLLGLH